MQVSVQQSPWIDMFTQELDEHTADIRRKFLRNSLVPPDKTPVGVAQEGVLLKQLLLLLHGQLEGEAGLPEHALGGLGSPATVRMYIVNSRDTCVREKKTQKGHSTHVFTTK